MLVTWAEAVQISGPGRVEAGFEDRTWGWDGLEKQRVISEARSSRGQSALLPGRGMRGGGAG